MLLKIISDSLPKLAAVRHIIFVRLRTLDFLSIDVM